jgi:hypothetical protein
MNKKAFDEALTELLDSLPEESLTRANLLVVRGAYRVGEVEERRLASVLRQFAQEGQARLRFELGVLRRTMGGE